MRAVTRRLGDHGDTKMTSGNLTLDSNTHLAVYGDTECSLTVREFALLSALLMKPGTVLSRSELERKVYAWEEQVDRDAVEVEVHGMPRKLGASVIRNVR